MYLYKKKKKGGSISRSETPISKPQTPQQQSPRDPSEKLGLSAPMRVSELMKASEMPQRMKLTNSMQILAYRIRDAFDSSAPENGNGSYRNARPESREVPLMDQRAYAYLNGGRDTMDGGIPPVPPMPPNATYGNGGYGYQQY